MLSIKEIKELCTQFGLVEHNIPGSGTNDSGFMYKFNDLMFCYHHIGITDIGITDDIIGIMSLERIDWDDYVVKDKIIEYDKERFVKELGLFMKMAKSFYHNLRVSKIKRDFQ